jgi:Carboxypeptidase regulatory-like domain
LHTPLRALAIVCVIVFLGRAQLTRGFLSGMVTDASGGVVKDVIIRITYVDTNVFRETRTNAVGVYRFVAVEPGSYQVEFSKPGLATKRFEKVTVSTSQEVVLNPSLDVGGTVTQIDVAAADAPVIELAKSTPTISQTLNKTLIQDLPVFAAGNQDRDLTRLALLSPTVTRGPGSTELSVNGQRARNNNFTVDGMDNNDLSVTLINSRIIPESVAEFQVQANSYSAEFGRNSGGQIHVITRGGTNQFHGEVYEYYNGNWLQPVSLLNRRAGLSKTPRFDQNEAGGDLGGPVIKDRTFFFGLMETNRFRQAPDARNATSVNIPTPQGFAALSQVPLATGQTAQSRQAALNAINFFSNLYPSISRFDSPSVQLINGVSIPIGNVFIPLANPFNYWYYQGRVDHKLTQKDNLSYRFELDKRNQPNFASNLGFGSRFAAAQTIFAQNHSLSESHVFNPRFINEFRFAFIRRNLNFPENDPHDPTTTVTNAFTIGGLANYPQGRIQNTFQFQEIATYQVGRHALKFGADIRRNRLFNISEFDSKGTYTFNNFADFINSQPNRVVQAVNTATFDARQTNQFYFAQDDLKATRDITLNIGLRYEYSDVPFGFFGAANAQVEAVGVPQNVRPDKNNWAPRLGIAYSPGRPTGFLKSILGDGQTVFRGGYGMAYDILFYNILTVNASNYPRVVVNQKYSPDANNLYPQLLPRSAVPLIDPRATFVNSPTDTQNPTTHFYSFSIQREIAGTNLLELGYSGNRSYHQIRQAERNPGILMPQQAQTVLATQNSASIPSLQARRVNPAWGSRVSIEATAISNYNALYFRYEKRLSRGLQFGANYTYSGTFSDNDEALGVTAITSSSPQIPQDYFNYRNEYSRSAFDRPQRLVFYYNYATPWFKTGVLSGRLLRGVFGGWLLSGYSEFQSGQPFTIFTGVDTGGNGAANAQRPNYNPAGTFVKDPVTGNLRTFAIPLDGTGIVVTSIGPNGKPLINTLPGGGNLGRNTFRGPGYQSWNVSFAKTFKATERLRITIRSDWTDFFNHRNFGNPVSSVNAPNFGANTSDPGTRSAFLGAKVSF